MKYNPRVAHHLASLTGFLQRHPYHPTKDSQGFLACLFELQEMLLEITGMSAVSLAPMAGSQGELAGVAMIMAYHHARGDFLRNEMLIPDNAHGTNPASAAIYGLKVREIPTLPNGDIDLSALLQMVGPQTAGMMMTNPSTFGLFKSKILEIAEVIHQAGGLLYYDGANLNAILGQARPGDYGFRCDAFKLS